MAANNHMGDGWIVRNFPLISYANKQICVYNYKQKCTLQKSKITVVHRNTLAYTEVIKLFPDWYGFLIIKGIFGGKAMFINTFTLITFGFLVWFYRKAKDRERSIRPVPILVRNAEQRTKRNIGGK